MIDSEGDGLSRKKSRGCVHQATHLAACVVTMKCLGRPTASGINEMPGSLPPSRATVE